MKKSNYLLSILLLCLGVFMHSTIFANEKDLPPNRIKCGTATISGKIINYNELRMRYSDFDEVQFNCAINGPLTGNNEIIIIEIKDDGSFTTKVPLETSHSTGFIWINRTEQEGYVVSLEVDKETKLDFSFENGKFSVEWISGPNFVFGKANDWYTARGKAVNLELSWGDYDLDALKSFIADPQKLASFSLESQLTPKLEILEKTPMPKAMFDICKADIMLEIIPNMFYYQSDIWELYARYKMKAQKELGISERIEFTKSDSITYYLPNPGTSYWAFLKKFELNNPNYLYSGLTCDKLRIMLTHNMRSIIPEIEEMPIEDWLKITKSILSDKLGFKDGQFYDVLICVAYASYFMESGKPLSTQQIKNIKQYYKGGEVEKILLQKNIKVEKYAKEKRLKAEQTMQKMNELLSKYKGKTVVVDFWATWCGPCMKAMKEIDLIKQDYINKGVVFVYITDESSPKEKWEAAKPTIEGEHYYLTKEEWKDIMKAFDFRAIPAYVVYDKEGNKVDKLVGYPGNDKMKELIDKALSK